LRFDRGKYDILLALFIDSFLLQAERQQSQIAVLRNMMPFYLLRYNRIEKAPLPCPLLQFSKLNRERWTLAPLLSEIQASL